MGEVKDSSANVPPAKTDRHRQDAAERIILGRALWSAGAGAIPFAFVDMAAVSVLQLDMLRKLADLYGVPFDRHRGRSAIAVLIGGIVPVAIGHGYVASAIFQSLVRSTPIIGPAIGMATVGGFAAAATFAVGRVFNQHFASGGTFLTFDPKKVEAKFREQFATATRKAAPVAGGAAA